MCVTHDAVGSNDRPVGWIWGEGRLWWSHVAIAAAHLLCLALLEQANAHVDHHHTQNQATVWPCLQACTGHCSNEQNPDEEPAGKSSKTTTRAMVSRSMKVPRRSREVGQLLLQSLARLWL